MKCYVVGGAVRDRLLGQPVNDRDWVVVGATPEQMIGAGYTQVGRDFPVFLHPRSHEEYALARTERKSAPGYRGFVVHAAPDVTLEDDLARRDLTINAIAQDPDTGALIDPHGGQHDLQARLLRHVGPAFVEDPVRLLRVARFAARWPDFAVAADTLALMHDMVRRGEVDALVPERVWQELARGLMELRPDRMLQVLRDCDALARLLPEVDALWGVPQPAAHHPEIDTGAHLLLVLQQCARMSAPLPVRFAALCHDLGKACTPPALWPRHIGHETHGARLAEALAQRWRVDAACRELAVLAAREHGHVHRSGDLGATALVRLLDRCDAWRRPDRFEALLQVCEADARGRLGHDDDAYPPRQRLWAALGAARTVDTESVAAAARARGAQGPAIGRAIQRARAAALVAARLADDGSVDAPVPDRA
ncbi:MAG: multifunctional CCA addition/repair protein [Aquabacterium sp.]|jgi:tRNA nucleotidyltransferase (CCA-adding enzyme)|nr:multifunctional CCA addition/repair protein [Aquabacterium sp.]